MSTTEHDLDESVSDDLEIDGGRDADTGPADTIDHDSAAEEVAEEVAEDAADAAADDARDQALVDSIEQYTAEDASVDVASAADDARLDDDDASPTLFEDDDFGDDDFEDDDRTFDVPSIVAARSLDDSADEPVDRAPARDTIDEPTVSNDILEELRRADIDGPVVDLAPQDDTTSVRRRPKRPVDYDPAPVPIPLKVPRLLGRKPRVRKVTRVVRHVDPWSVFKIALIAHMVLYVIVLTAGVLLWNVAYATGTVDNVERFFESFGWQSFEFNGGEIYHSAWIAGLFLVLGLTGLAVLAATLFNLITDLVGGVRFTVLEEEVVESRTSPMRRFVVRRLEPEIPAVTHDSSGALIREAVVDDTGGMSR